MTVQPLSQAELRDDRIRRLSAGKISTALAATEGRPGIVRLLAIGAVCPGECMAGPGRAIWLDVVSELMEGN